MKNLRVKNWILNIVFAIAVGAFLFSGTAYAKNKPERISSATKGNVIEVTVEFPAPVITKVDGYDHIEMEGMPSLGHTGEPVLPATGVNVLIPAGKDIKFSEVILGEKVTLPGKYTIEPAQQPVPLSYEGPVEKTLPKDEIYKSKNPYPKEKKEKVTTQKLRGYEIAVFKLHPVEYIPQDGLLSYYKTITLKVNLSPKSKKIMAQGEKVKKAPEVKRPKLRRLAKDKEKLQSFIVNTQDIQSYDTEPQEPAAGGVQPMGEGSGATTLVDPAESYQYVIITNEELKNAPGPYNFQALCAEKERRGITTKIVTIDHPTEGIYANYDGTRPSGGEDNATKIRNFIIDAYNNWETEYILLGGDATGNPSSTEIIPCRGLFDQISLSIADELPSDLYYCCLDGSMDYDADGMYGEFSPAPCAFPNDGPDGGEIDLLAEVYIGRAPIVTQEELSNFVNKTLTYCNTSSKYLMNTYMVGEHMGWGGVVEYATPMMEQIRLGSDAHGYTTAGFQTFSFLELNTLYDAPGYMGMWPKSNLIDIINNGVNVINHLGHGGFRNVMKMSNSDVDALINTEYFFGYSQACDAGAFNWDCIVEHFVKNPTGAVAFVANSRFGWGKVYSTAGPSQYYARQFWDAVFGENIYNLGKINEDSKEDNLWAIDYKYHRWCYLELNLFGDPELSLRFGSDDAAVGFGREAYGTSSLAGIFLIDTDLNINPAEQDEVQVYVTSETETTPEIVTLIETDTDTSVFTGSIQLQQGTSQSNGTLEVGITDTITVRYEEVHPAGTKTDTAEVDGILPLITKGPSVSDPKIEIVYKGSITITWQTDKPSTSTLYYGQTTSLENSVTSPSFVTNHSFTLNRLIPDTEYYFAVESRDSAGNLVYDDNEGSLYQFFITSPVVSVSPLSFEIEVEELTSPHLTRTLTISNTAVDSVELIFKINSSEEWCFTLPYEGEVAAGSSIDIEINIEPPPLEVGSYSGEILINNNSPLYITVPVILTVLPAPACFLQSYKIIDDWSGRTFMVNGDGKLNAGERVELQLTLENIGSLPAQDVTAKLLLKEVDQYVTILDDRIDFGDIPEGSSIVSLDNFLIEIDEATPINHTVSFMVEISDSGGRHWYEECKIPILAYDSIFLSALRLDTDTPGTAESSQPQISSDNNGNIYVAWADDREGIYFNYSRDYGATWQANDIRLNRVISYQPQISSDENGNVYVVWAGAGIYFNYSRDYGATWQANPISLSMRGVIPQISSDNNGNIYVVWNGVRSGVHDVCFNYSNDYGATWQASYIRLNSVDDPYVYAMGPHISSDDKGNIYVPWTDSRNGRNDIYFDYSYDYGATWQANDIRLDTDIPGSGYSVSPQISSDNNGNLYVVWEDYRNGKRDIYLNYSCDYGATWQASDIRLDADTAGTANSYVPQISSDNDGNLYVVWEDYRNGKRDIYLNYSSDYGATWQANDVRLNTDTAGTADSSQPQISSDNDGNAYVVWRGCRNGEFDIYFNYSSDYGATWQANDTRLNTDTAGTANSSQPQISSDNDGNAYVVWQDYRNGKSDIYFCSKYIESGILNFIPDQQVMEETLLEFDITAQWNLELFFDVKELSQELQLNISTATMSRDFEELTGITRGRFSWIPAVGTAGEYYPVVFVARDPTTGRCAYERITITVLPPPPIADFIAAPTEGEVPLTVNFTDTSTGDIDFWSWYFGDGQSSHDQNPTNTYNSVGTYSVYLGVSGPAGDDVAYKVDCVTVTFSGEIYEAHAGQEIVLYGDDIDLYAEASWFSFDNYGWLCNDGHGWYQEFMNRDLPLRRDSILRNSINTATTPAFMPGKQYSIKLRASRIISDAARVDRYSEPFTVIVARDGQDIQDDIDAASSWDTVPIEPGIYMLSSNDLLIKDNITLKATDPNPDNTVIILRDHHIITNGCSSPDNIIYVTIEGVTIKDYTGTSASGPIQNHAADLTLKNCKIVDNKGTMVSAIYNGRNSILHLDNTLIARNKNFPEVGRFSYGQTGYGSYVGYAYCGTIYLDTSSKLYVEGSTIADNSNEIDSFTIETGYGRQEIPIVYGAIVRYYANHLEIKDSILWNNENGKDVSQRFTINQVIDITNSDIEQESVIGQGTFEPIHIDPDLDDAYVPQNPDPRLFSMGARF